MNHFDKALEELKKESEKLEIKWKQKLPAKFDGLIIDKENQNVFKVMKPKEEVKKEIDIQKEKD